MQPYFTDDLVTIYTGDCLDVMKVFPENSVDTILTDPPYGLKFMGKNWDHSVPGVPYWAEALRVAKPGAYLLAFGGTRTYHRLTCAIEDAGWEIRDCINWLYGSSFPKSHDISKAIDKAAGAERKEFVPNFSADGRNRGAEPSKGKIHDGDIMQMGFRERAEFNKTLPVSEAAQTWHGWGTGLKPAWEPIIVAMKPIEGTFANNALTWGVAGLNIEGCRIGIESTIRNSNAGTNGDGWGMGKKQHINGSIEGRWPANVILDEYAAELLDEQSGILTSGKPVGIRKANNKIYGRFETGTPISCFGDSGGASRFFYTAKAAPNERGEDNDHPTVKPLDLMKYLCRLTATPLGGVILDPFMGSGTTLLAAREMGRKSIGIEINEKDCRTAKKRMKQGMLNFAG